MIKNHISMLGLRCKDKVTGITGVVTSVYFDLNGCVQGLLHPGIDDRGKMLENYWFDIARLEQIEGSPVMDAPDFGCGDVAEGKKGPAEKPCPNKY